MDEFLNVRYKLCDSQGFEEYMKALGVGLVLRKMGNAMTPVVCLTEANGVYTLTTVTTFKNQTISFKPGVEFEEETLDGRKVKTEMQFEGSKIIQIQKDSNGQIITTIEREFSKEQMKSVLKAGNIICTRIYDRVQE